MKVWIIEAFSAEMFSNGHWIDSVWPSKEDAIAYLEQRSEGEDVSWSDYSVGPFDSDPDDLDAGYFLRMPKDYFVGITR